MVAQLKRVIGCLAFNLPVPLILQISCFVVIIIRAKSVCCCDPSIKLDSSSIKAAFRFGYFDTVASNVDVSLPAGRSTGYCTFTGLKGKARSAFPTISATNMAMNMESSSEGLVNEVDHVDMLDASFDAFEGVIINIKDDMDENVFTSLLQTSISQWRQQGKKGVWLKLSLELVNLVKPAVKEGFWYHHAEPTYVMLVYWIPETNHTLPPNASHRVGVASFVANSKGEILVVQEKSGAFKGTGVWKLPTGTVEEGEDITAAAIREVKEEAGIDTEFMEVLAFRQSHKSFFSKSDLMFVCMLKPTSFDIQKQDSEIEAAQWMPVEEYANQPFIKNHKSFDYIAKICIAKKDNKYVGFTPLLTTTATSAKKSYLYSNYQLEQ